MKKLLGIAVGILSAVGLCAEDIASDLTLETNVQFQSERVFRGRNEFHQAWSPQVKVGHPVCDEGNVYVGIDTALHTKGGSALNQWSACLGVLWDVAELFTVDGGYRHRSHTSLPEEAPEKRRHSHEIHGGIIVDVLLEPSLYCFYDFTREELAIEGRIKYNFDLSQYAFSGLGVNLGAKVGFDQAGRPYGLTYDNSMGKKSYSYYGVNADLIYELNNNARVKIGIAYEGNSAEQSSWTNGSVLDSVAAPSHRNNLWANASVDCSF
ncbi:MAG: hypothetical protein LBC30_01190 [Puniceicoccales bacterium]|nr:hypothetical protein [Puniceicoccales bacterium]